VAVPTWNVSERGTLFTIKRDHPIFRDGLRRLLETETDFKVLGEASDGIEAVTVGAPVEARHFAA